MALEKQVVVDLIEALENGVVQVRTATRIVEDGETVSSSLHRHVVAPGNDYSQEDAKVQAICAVIQTADVIAAYQAAQKADQPVALEE
jgi:hypothetical protein